MTPSPVDYPTLLSQLPFVSKLATAEQTKHEVRQELFGPMIVEQQRLKNKEQVPEINKKEKAVLVHEDGGNDQSGHPGERSKHEAKDDSPEDTDTSSANSSPWTGNIIDRKI
ncbi:MAG: hypothetical protein KKB70_07800 [Proteobacteria bacterium]|nr:hypothetical protein [Pseudomonadota bacterium]MBU1611121.1 hypothetical protein [Pseudomonadota bacterium]